MTKREFLDTVFTLAPNEANKIMDAFDEYVESNEPHWIPVTERLPKIDNYVLACNCYDDVEIISLETDGHGMLYWKDGFEDTEALNDIKAWMPLPEAYKGVTE